VLLPGCALASLSGDDASGMGFAAEPPKLINLMLWLFICLKPQFSSQVVHIFLHFVTLWVTDNGIFLF
jgi:hypothetical protein